MATRPIERAKVIEFRDFLVSTAAWNESLGFELAVTFYSDLAAQVDGAHSIRDVRKVQKTLSKTRGGTTGSPNEPGTFVPPGGTLTRELIEKHEKFIRDRAKISRRIFW